MDLPYISKPAKQPSKQDGAQPSSIPASCAISKAADKAADLIRKGRPFQTAVFTASDLFRVSFQGIAQELSRRGRARRAKKAA